MRTISRSDLITFGALLRITRVEECQAARHHKNEQTTMAKVPATTDDDHEKASTKGGGSVSLQTKTACVDDEIRECRPNAKNNGNNSDGNMMKHAYSQGNLFAPNAFVEGRDGCCREDWLRTSSCPC